MKKIFMMALLVSTMIFVGCGSEKPSEPAQNKDKTTIGVIAHLNAHEIEYNEIMKKLEKSYRPSNVAPNVDYKYYDDLNSMILALEAGQIDMLSTYQSVADSMFNQTNNKELLPSEKRLENSFCFAVRDGDTILRNELNKAIKNMTADGTLANLSKTYIFDLKNGEEPHSVKIEKIDGADTIKVAVTGDLPPFDFVLSDGTPAGFSTAVLAEVSKRIGKNIEIINTDSASRASVLTSKSADVIFWVAVPKNSTLIPANIDQPTGILITEPYYHDTIVHVGIKK